MIDNDNHNNNNNNDNCDWFSYLMTKPEIIDCMLPLVNDNYNDNNFNSASKETKKDTCKEELFKRLKIAMTNAKGFVQENNEGWHPSVKFERGGWIIM